MTTHLHPIIIGTRSDAGLPLAPGALVTYHGRRLGERYTTFYVADVDEDGRYEITDRDYPTVTTMWVYRQHISPTGATITLCGCGHEASWSGRSTNHGWCEVQPCDCQRHNTIRDEN